MGGTLIFSPSGVTALTQQLAASLDGEYFNQTNRHDD